MAARPIAEGLFHTDPPRLIGGRSKSDGRIVFPMPSGAEAARYEPLALATEGKLWSFTVQRFRPKSPPYAGHDDERSFKPFALGYVELDGQVIVESRLEVDSFDQLKIGLPMRLDLVPFQTAPHGEEVLSYVFRPAEGA
jgi:uncharacterized OB-fold protein